MSRTVPYLRTAAWLLLALLFLYPMLWMALSSFKSSNAEILARSVFYRHDSAGAILPHSADGFARATRHPRQPVGIDSFLHGPEFAGGGPPVRRFFRCTARRTRRGGQTGWRWHGAVL